tara:strand:- start:169 stop:729 length:561 start_codon:yes stop_codon:yes gene_type:complete
MARRKNVKRIDPRYFLNETVNRGEELEERMPGVPKSVQHDRDLAGRGLGGKEAQQKALEAVVKKVAEAWAHKAEQGEISPENLKWLGDPYVSKLGRADGKNAHNKVLKLFSAPMTSRKDSPTKYLMLFAKQVGDRDLYNSVVDALYVSGIEFPGVYDRPGRTGGFDASKAPEQLGAYAGQGRESEE